MRRRVPFALSLLVAACHPHGTSVYVTVDAGATITGIDHLHVVVDNAGMTSKGTDFPFPTRPATMPPAQTLRLTFDEGRVGAAALHIDAVDATGTVLASGSAQAQLIADTETQALVVLGTRAVADAGATDSSIDGGSAGDGGSIDGSTVDQGVKRLVATFIPVGLGPGGVAAADFNGDALADAIVANGQANNVAVLLGKGDGSFRLAEQFMTGKAPLGLVASDFNGDSRLDVAVTNTGDGTVTTLVQTPNGTQRSSLPAAATPTPIVAGDLNRDGRIDLAVGNGGTNTVGIYVGNGNGTFQMPVNVTTSLGPLALALGDVDGDRFLDLAVVCLNAASVQVLQNLPGLNWKLSLDYRPGTSPLSLLLPDLNGDGRADLVVGDYTANTLLVRMNDGMGGFRAGTPITTPFPTAFVVADFDKDGANDLAMLFYAGQLGFVSRVAPTGDLKEGIAYWKTGRGAQFMATADFNGNGFPDLVFTDRDDNDVGVLLDPGKP